MSGGTLNPGLRVEFTLADCSGKGGIYPRPDLGKDKIA